ncbi:MAG: hypothetical protein ABFD89_25090 [Bryobacteraceae bacterium]
MRIILSLLFLAGAAFGEDLLIGYRQQGLSYQGPGEWRQSAEPIWVWDYHTLRLQYRASGFPKSDGPVLTLRPGSVGPVTPGATNPENPFVAGAPVVVVMARDLVADNAPHSLELELRGKMRTAQVDQLIFALPAGARLHIEDLQFVGDPDVFPCRAGGPGLPEGVKKLAAHGPSTCAGSPSTSLRGREEIQIETGGHKGGTLYLSLMAHFANASAFAGVAHYTSDKDAERWRVKESTETADFLARVEYTDGSVEDQFPLLTAERRHTLLNRKPSLYALSLDPSRGVRSVALLDRSPHAQVVLYGAGLSKAAQPEALDQADVPPGPAANRPAKEPNLDGSQWFTVTASKDVVQPEYHSTPGPGRRDLSLTLTNVSKAVQEFTVVFPSLTVRPTSDPADVYYVFPRPGAVISNADRKLEGAYSNAFPLQFMEVFAPRENCGVSVIVHDTEGRAKKFRLKKNGATVEAEVEYKVRLAPGETFRLPEAHLVPHGGNWREGFDAYRDWVKTWYKPAGPRPAWLHTAFWARRDYPIGGTGLLFDEHHNRYTYDKFIKDGEAFGGIDFVDISGFSLSKAVGRVGDYVIELGGPEDLRRNIAIGMKANIPTGLYFAGYHIDKNSNVYRERGKNWQIINKNGQGFWWSGEVELWVCPYIPEWRQFLGGRMAEVAKEVGAQAVYLDVFGTATDGERCFSTQHGHVPGADPLPGEIAMAKEVRRNLDANGLRDTIIYLEYNPPDAAAPYYDGAFCYDLTFADRTLSPLKLNLWRFTFPDVRLWDMLSIGINPRVLSAEDFRLSLWHGNGLWLKGNSDTWYGEDLLAFIRRSHSLLKQHATAFAGVADPLVKSPHPSVFINRFRGGEETIHTLFNASYRTARFHFLGKERTLGPRDVDVVAGNK